ncbi:ATP-binding protein, partial [Paracoccus endophyticus]|uniref:ATP-binding protein n=1 Tax=Paracoccus endophyticus TaxID=2233774 RepID=UPI001F0BE301
MSLSSRGLCSTVTLSHSDAAKAISSVALTSSAALKRPTFLREHQTLARQCAAEGVDHVRYLARLVELELIDRERRVVERRIKAAKVPAVKSLDSFDFAAIPKLNRMQVLELARCEWMGRRENVIALVPSETGKTHVALGIGLAACRKGLSVGLTAAAALVSEMIEARDERRLLRFHKQRAGHKLLILYELGFVPLSKTGAELLFELISQRCERGRLLRNRPALRGEGGGRIKPRPCDESHGTWPAPQARSTGDCPSNEPALLHKSGDGRGCPSPGQSYPTASVTGMPRAV